ncbi:hypothetical protein [Cellulomonas alba]|uniref:Uncharacterized protein n=1 Tax=Cellulomonas alba TaxID=3053467 RepID=A0ABT7SKB5_9CELL|nr:hypothetical protein [Cellulomonas alba]MDM7856629.1 hypothetical protein [Cellulomonas alba]
MPDFLKSLSWDDAFALVRDAASNDPSSTGMEVFSRLDRDELSALAYRLLYLIAVTATVVGAGFLERWIDFAKRHLVNDLP